MAKYSLGIDFGTLSGRAVLFEVETGTEVATAIKEYTHGVMDEFLPDGVNKLSDNWALQHPNDYLEVLKTAIPEVIQKSNINPDDIIGLGIDFTASTIMPIDSHGTPLCMLEEFSSNPHSYVKLWKHHAAQNEANLINEIAECRGEKFLKRYGGKISSEWLIPKIWETLKESPEVYHTADQFIEAGDWVIYLLTGEFKRSSCFAGYKATWHKREGYPSKDFFKALDPRLENVVEEKLSNNISSIGMKAGEITKESAGLTGLRPGTPVAIAIIDAHAAVPAAGISEPNKLLMIMGTSTCHILLNEKEVDIPGICGIVEDGIIPGFMAYEAGQSCVGDHFEWFIQNCIPTEYERKAREKNVHIHEFLTEMASKIKPGETGLLALDWWNGNRSTLVDANLSGVILGMNLQTRPEEIYRCLIEATAFGSRVIVENFREHGIPIEEIYACGGIAEKNPLMMQIYADVLNIDIKIADSAQTAALGSAIFGAVAAGGSRGGYDTIRDASKAMSRVKDKVYRPIPENANVYNELFKEYERLYNYFGLENNIMKKLIRIKNERSRCSPKK
ncbi:ribulokinase [Neobacillus notoginsengisoli]|uniref:Ribulokinase n=1 Tax=Neobacillus notoginsengisoli TaxID=1578198 RepID=A0A417YIN9_9BACI|nr:ribulokinase [Neobacillus notoginsengisoli]RHW32807.1 ribulokinase [Neobacillus notoginsengisoli]